MCVLCLRENLCVTERDTVCASRCVETSICEIKSLCVEKWKCVIVGVCGSLKDKMCVCLYICGMHVCLSLDC